MKASQISICPLHRNGGDGPSKPIDKFTASDQASSRKNSIYFIEYHATGGSFGMGYRCSDYIRINPEAYLVFSDDNDVS